MRGKASITLCVLIMFVGCNDTLSRKSPVVESLSTESSADAVIIEAIEHSDDFQKHRAAFVCASRQLIDEGRCGLEALEYNGGWIRSQIHQGGATYFTYLVGRGATVRDRIYLNVNTAELFK